MTDSLDVLERNALMALTQAQTKLEKIIRSCASRYWNKLCDDIQKASDEGNSKEIYRALNKTVGPKVKNVCLLKQLMGLIIDSAQKMAIWVEHYSELYGEPRSISNTALSSTPNFETMTELDDVATM